MIINADDVGIYCLSACIKSQLKRMKILVDEEELFCCENMLTTVFNKTFGGLTSAVEKNIFENCLRHNIILKKVETQHRNKWFSKKNFIFNIDCKYLEYSKAYRNISTNQSRHYINLINKCKGDLYYIQDEYIPTNPPCIFQGWIKLEEKSLSDVIIYSIRADSYLKWGRDRKIGCILSSIENYFKQLCEEKPIEKFESNVQLLSREHFSENERRRKCYEMAVNIAVGGISASRMLFWKNIKKSVPVSGMDVYEEKIKTICTGYFQLRILLVKFLYSGSKLDMERIKYKVRSISDLEMKTFNNFFEVISQLGGNYEKNNY